MRRRNERAESIAGADGDRGEGVERRLIEIRDGEDDPFAGRVGPPHQVGQVLALEAVPPEPLSSSVPFPLASMEK